MNNLLVGTVNVLNVSFAKFCGDGIEGLDLSLGLDIVEWISVG